MGSPEGQGEAAGCEERTAGLRGQHGLCFQGVTSIRPRKKSFIEKTKTKKKPLILKFCRKWGQGSLQIQPLQTIPMMLLILPKQPSWMQPQGGSGTQR